MAFVNFPLFDNGTAFSDLTVLVCDFCLGSYPFSCFVIKYASGGNLDVRFGKQFPFTEYEVDVVIGLAFVMMQSRCTFHSVLLSEFVRKFFKHLLRVRGISFVCLRPDGAYESPSTVGVMTRSAKKKLEGFEDFHFHMLRHTFTSNLLSNGAAPKDVQELLGHADVSTTMNIYAHSKREAKRTSARLLDKVVGEA